MLSTSLGSINPELSNKSHFFKFRLLYGSVEPLEVYPLTDFLYFSEIIGEIQDFLALFQSLNVSISSLMCLNGKLFAMN